jgi:hypothetical protein
MCVAVRSRTFARRRRHSWQAFGAYFALAPGLPSRIEDADNGACTPSLLWEAELIIVKSGPLGVTRGWVESVSSELAPSGGLRQCNPQGTIDLAA